MPPFTGLNMKVLQKVVGHVIICGSAMPTVHWCRLPRDKMCVLALFVCHSPVHDSIRNVKFSGPINVPSVASEPALQCLD